MEEAVRQTSSMYERDFVLSSEFEEMLLKLCGSSAQQDIFELAKKVVEKYAFGATHHVILVAFLVDAGQLSINDASKLLHISIESSEEGLNDVISHVLDVAWLTNEDEKDELMSPDADDVLLVALKKVRESLLSAN